MTPAEGPASGRRCRIQQFAGRFEECSEGDCPLWEPGGAALPGRCAFDQVDFDGRPEFADWLIQIRDRLAAAAPDGNRQRARDTLYELLDAGDVDED
jgi:hypothetical protein